MTWQHRRLTDKTFSIISLLCRPFGRISIFKFINFKCTLYIIKQMAADFMKLTLVLCPTHLKQMSKNWPLMDMDIQANDLKEFKLHFGRDINVPTKIKELGVFDYRSFLWIWSASISCMTQTLRYLLLREKTLFGKVTRLNALNHFERLLSMLIIFRVSSSKIL